MVRAQGGRMPFSWRKAAQMRCTRHDENPVDFRVVARKLRVYSFLK